jgi:transcriptional regulator with XRE-family HTH domain
MTEKALRKILGRNIKRLRSYHELSQAEFAEKVDISIPFLSDIENGKKWGSPAMLVKMAAAFNIEVYELLKPETVIPDSAQAILEKYTDEILKTFGKTLNGIQRTYLEQLNART